MRQAGRLLVLAAASVAAAGLAAAPGAAGQDAGGLQVHLERTAERGFGSLWVGIRAVVTEAGTPFAQPHQVFAVALNDRGDESEPFRLKILEIDDPGATPGTHEGFVIVPYGGRWTLTAVVNRFTGDEDAPPEVLARGGALDVEVEGPAAPAGGAVGGPGGAAGLDPPSVNVPDVAVLWIHTLLAVGWAVTVAVLALLALPAGRRLLAEAAANLADSRLDTVVRAMWWLTGLVVATGVYNLVNSVPYRVPLTPGQVERLFQLPWAQAYYVDLVVKLALYAAMVTATVPLGREARRRADEWSPPAGAAVAAGTDPSPWAPVEVGAGGRLALRTRNREVAVAPVPAGAARDGGPDLTPLVAALVVGGALLVLAVTLLVYFHRLSEVARFG